MQLAFREERHKHFIFNRDNVLCQIPSHFQMTSHYLLLGTLHTSHFSLESLINLSTYNALLLIQRVQHALKKELEQITHTVFSGKLGNEIILKVYELVYPDPLFWACLLQDTFKKGKAFHI